MKQIFPFSVILCVLCIYSLNCQIRVAVLPFQNMDGDLSLNVISYKLQDSVANLLREKDPEGKHFTIIPSDSIDFIVSQFNLDPVNPQYPSDIWKAVQMLNANVVVSGTFNRKADRILINAYIYDVATKLAYPDYQARDIFKTEENVMEAVPIIVKRLLPGLIGQ
jgi:TolB-like protein